MLLNLFRERERKRDKCSREKNSALIFIMAFPSFLDTKEMVDHVRETFKWHLKRTLCPSRPLSEDYQNLCPSFTLRDAEETTCNFDILEII